MKLEVSTFYTRCGDKAQALKVLEESAEVYGAWQNLNENLEFQTQFPRATIAVTMSLEDLADELADVITAACNLAGRYDIDLQAALDRCEQRNRERGRYDERS